MALCVPLLLGACSDDGGGAQPDPDTAVVTYRFIDSSVPPDYHRSYTLTVADGEARMVVDSYGDELHDVTQPVDDATWSELLDRATPLDGVDEDGDDGCVGGTSHRLRVTDADHPDDDPVVAASVYRCQGGEEQAAALADAVRPVLDQFDLGTLLAPG
jgi:hypothetical protein